jgi:hypothetical protein
VSEHEERDLHDDPTVVTHVPDLGLARRASMAPPKRAATPEELHRLRHVEAPKADPPEAA